MSKEEQSLLAMLKEISNGDLDTVTNILGNKYTNALEVIGYCKKAWNGDTRLTRFGKKELQRLQDKNRRL